MKYLRTKGGIAAIAAVVMLAVPLAAWANPSSIKMFDACSPSFNELFQDPTICNRNGGTPVTVFLRQLEQNKRAGAWHFSAPRVKVRAGDSLTVENRSGETHSLSPVSQFGGGGVAPPLNVILFGTPNPPLFFINPDDRASRASAQLRACRRGDDFGTHADAGHAPVHLCDPSPDGREDGRSLTFWTHSGAETYVVPAQLRPRASVRQLEKRERRFE